MTENSTDSSGIVCNHCGRIIEETDSFCPWCNSPTPLQQEKDLSAVRKKFMYLVIGIAVFCAVMILWLPR